MEVDWEFEVGGGAPVIEARWAGFVDLRRQPERIKDIHETTDFPPLAALLQALNGTHSPLWTAKCDLWEPEVKELGGQKAESPADGPEAGMHNALACYVDLLPLAGEVFAQAEQAEVFCRNWVARMAPVPLAECRVDLIIRQAIAGEAEGFGVTAYLSAMGSDHAAAREALAGTLATFADTIPDLEQDRS
jgi:hypothetical protein